jgi:hexosaminidase
VVGPSWLLAVVASGCARPATGPVSPAPGSASIIPAPRQMQAGSGRFRLDRMTRIMLSDPTSTELRTLVELLAAPLRVASGLPLPVSPYPADDRTPDAISLRLTPGAASVEPESYRLVVTPQGARLSSPTATGLFWGLQTVRQLLPPEFERRKDSATPVRWTIPALEIEDAPRFPYRGLLLDVARWYYPPEFIKKLIDLLALYKLNTLQLHLTDDQGWRLEIRKYPLLTEIGAWRKETILEKHFDPYAGDGRPHGGFYTQEQMRDLVAYAQAHHVTIVPEIEMPGHAGAGWPRVGSPCAGGPGPPHHRLPLPQRSGPVHDRWL